MKISKTAFHSYLACDADSWRLRANSGGFGNQWCMVLICTLIMLLGCYPTGAFLGVSTTEHNESYS